MVKSLLELCLNIINKPCRETNLSKYWLNYGYRCISFKFGQKIRYQEFWFCTCKCRTFKITYVERKKEYSITTRAKNCFHCWFVFLIEIKLDKLHKYRNNLIYFVSLFQDFFLFINKFKYIYILPNYTNKKYSDLKYESFSYYLSVNDPCLCYHSEDPF